LAYLRQVMQLAVDLGCPRIVAPLPALPADDADPRQATLHEALTALDRDADRLGLQVALEAGIDTGANVRNVLGRYERGRLAVTFDPANFLLNGHDPVAEAAALGDRIVLVHARDARAERTSRGSGRETAPGAGDVDWLALTATLDAAGVHVPMLIERTEGTTRREDVATGAKFLRRFVTAAIRM
jgi:sugar phosphate isomerase/epimerase